VLRSSEWVKSMENKKEMSFPKSDFPALLNRTLATIGAK
jgi:hypothetical protein